MNTVSRAVACGALAALAAGAAAEPGERVDVEFVVTRTVGAQSSVFVLGDLPELGGGDIRLAPKLTAAAYPEWRLTVSLPAGRDYEYTFYERNDGPGDLGLPSNGAAFAGPFQDATAPPSQAPGAKTIVFETDLEAPALWFRQPGIGSGAFERVELYDVGPGPRAGDTRWAAPGIGVAGRAIEFYAENEAGPGRVPSTGAFETEIDELVARDIGVFPYAPGASVPSPRRDHGPGGFNHTIFSQELLQSITYRVLLPRGYDLHTGRSYPVVYMHDGQNVFEADMGNFGSWDADLTSARLTREGAMRETIIVGIDNNGGTYRARYYLGSDDGGDGDDYARFIRDELAPVIDATYRTLTGPEHTGTIGSSFGGVCAMYQAWDFPGFFGRAGSFSPSWWAVPAFVSAMNADPNPAARVYLDSGDAGTSADGYPSTVAVRDALLQKDDTLAPYALEGGLRHRVGFFQGHNEAAWASRLGEALAFLFPASEETGDIASINLARRGDVDGDGDEDVDDLYAFESAAGAVNPDVDRVAPAFTPADRASLLGIVRAGGLADTLAAR